MTGSTCTNCGGAMLTEQKCEVRLTCHDGPTQSRYDVFVKQCQSCGALGLEGHESVWDSGSMGSRTFVGGQLVNETLGQSVNGFEKHSDEPPWDYPPASAREAIRAAAQ